MNLKNLTDECLLSETKRYVQSERDLLLIILHHLREVERRRLFGQSMTTYANIELLYPEDQAYRRVAAMHAMSELPEIEPQIAAGRLNLTHLNLARSFFNRMKTAGKPLSKQQKREVFGAIAGQSKLNTQRVLRALEGAAPRAPDSIRPLGEDRNLLSTEISDRLVENIKRLQGMLAHKHPHLTAGELFELLTDLALEQWDPARAPQRKVSEETKAAVRRKVWQRDGGACVRCGSTHALEIDHINPVAMGGDDSLENLRVLCRHCNQRAAIEKFGIDKMDPFLTPNA